LGKVVLYDKGFLTSKKKNEKKKKKKEEEKKTQADRKAKIYIHVPPVSSPT